MAQSNKVHLKVQSRTGFDKSFYNDLTTQVGTLTPVLFDEVIPNSSVNLNVAASVQLPPLASDTFMKCDLKLEAFAIPLRILYGGFMKWFVQQSAIVMDNFDPEEFNPHLPNFSITGAWDTFPTLFDDGLSDYLGLRLCSDSYQNTEISLLPYLAYGKVYDEYYRNVLVQRQLFADGVDPLNFNGGQSVADLPFISSPSVNFGYAYGDPNENAWSDYVDGSSVFGLKQRNYGFDYFTNAWPSPQVGQAMSVQTDENGKFTIASLRVANSLQQYSERMLYSPRYNEAIKQRYGCDISDAVVQRPYYLGSASISIKSYGVDVNADNADSDQSNPFANSAGAQLGRAVGQGVVNLIDNFEVREPSYIMVLASIVPIAVYATGTRRIMRRYVGPTGGFTDMAVATLQNVGNQPIYGWELNGRIGTSTVFAYTDRYADWCTMLDEVHGELREGKSLESFALKRDFYNEFAPNIGYRFLEIPITALDEVGATNIRISKYGSWMQFGFDYRVVMPLAFNSMPSLQDPAYEHGFDIEVKRGGFRL